MRIDGAVGPGRRRGQAPDNINTAQVPRSLRLPLANLCRRAGLVSVGLRLLSPLVYPEKSGVEMPATSAEVAEYAVLLERCGSTKEALQLLSRVNTIEVPEARLYRAFSLFTQWEYQAAIPELEQFLKSDASPYSIFVGRVNLAAALVVTELDKKRALDLLSENIEIAEKNNYVRLHGNCLELLAQVHIQDGDWTKAQQSLDTAESFFGSARVHDQLFVRKWQAVIDAFRTKSASPLLTFREEALLRGEPEGARDADLFSLMVEFDERRFNHLYFGTPFPAYRERIRQKLGRVPTVSEFSYGDASAPGIDLGQELPAKGLHRLFEALLKDFYCAPRVGGLFVELFPEETFNIFTSPKRVHQAVLRARRYLEGLGAPVEISCEDGSFALKMTGPFSFRVPLEAQLVDPNQAHLRVLREAFAGREFTAKDAREKLALSPSTFKRFATWAIEEGELTRLGAGSSTWYSISESHPALSAVG